MKSIKQSSLMIKDKSGNMNIFKSSALKNSSLLKTSSEKKNTPNTGFSRDRKTLIKTGSQARETKASWTFIVRHIAHSLQDLDSLKFLRVSLR